MTDTEKVAVLVKEGAHCWEGLRSTLGLLVDNLYGRVFYLDCPVELPEGKTEEEFVANLEMLDDLEGEAYTTVKADADRFEHLTYCPLDDMVPLIKEYDLVLPF